MSRSTQFIGLTAAARRYVEKRALRTELYDMTTGMFDEVIKGRIYHLPVPNGPNKEYYMREVVQTSPWSSGPMIFTHLKPVLVKECGQVLDMCGSGEGYFSWVLDPGLKEQHSECDQEAGTYYV